jgi:hypothetical protein
MKLRRNNWAKTNREDSKCLSLVILILIKISLGVGKEKFLANWIPEEALEDLWRKKIRKESSKGEKQIGMVWKIQRMKEDSSTLFKIWTNIQAARKINTSKCPAKQEHLLITAANLPRAQNAQETILRLKANKKWNERKEVPLKPIVTDSIPKGI